MAKPVIGISENEFTVGEETLIKINGTGLKPDTGKPDPVVALTSNDYNWAVVIYEIKNKYIVAGVTPTPKTAARKVKTSSDDVTVTITFDDNLTTEFDVEITCEDVDVEPEP